MIDPYYDKTGSVLYLGDCLNVMGEMEDNSVDAIVTDPPYGISFMGKKWDYKIPDVKVWKQCLRVLKPGGHLLCCAGTRTQHRMTVNIEDAGFEIRDTIGYLYSTQDRFRMLWETLDDEQRKLFHQVFDVDNLIGWGYGSGFPKSADIGKQMDQAKGMEREVLRPRTYELKNDGGYSGGLNTTEQRSKSCEITAPATPEAKQWDGWGTNLKPAIELIVMCRKPVSEKTIAANVLRWGTGAINIDGCRIGTEEEIGRNNNIGPYASKRTWSTSKTSPQNGIGQSQGRWPANLILSDSDEVRELFPETKSGENKSTHTTHLKDGYRPTNIHGKYKQISLNSPANEGSAARFFYVAKSSKAERNEGLEGMETKHKEGAEFRPNHMEKAKNGESGNSYGRWDKVKNNHPTVKPVSLMRQLIRLITPPGGVVLDPFSGSGSTLVAAQAEGFKAIGIELEEKYCTITVGRLRQPSLFSV